MEGYAVPSSRLITSRKSRGCLWVVEVFPVCSLVALQFTRLNRDVHQCVCVCVH